MRTFVKPETVTGKIKDSINSMFKSPPRAEFKTQQNLRDPHSRAQLSEMLYLLKNDKLQALRRCTQLEQVLKQRQQQVSQLQIQKLLLQKKYNDDLYQVNILHNQNQILRQQISEVNKLYLEQKLENDWLKQSAQNIQSNKQDYSEIEKLTQAVEQMDKELLIKTKSIKQAQSELLIEKTRVQSLETKFKMQEEREQQLVLKVNGLQERIDLQERQIEKLEKSKKEYQGLMQERNRKLEEVKNLANAWEHEYVQYLQI